MRAQPQTELTRLRELVATLQAALEQSRQENALLRQKVDALVRRVFGTSSEAIDPAQLELFLQLPAATSATPTAQPLPPLPEPHAPRARKESTPRLPENLPLVEEVIEPEPVQTAPEAWRCIGQEVNEQLDYEPGRFLRRRIVRRKYVHRTRGDLAPIIAPLPQSLRERGLAAPGLLAHILVSKYCDHLPLYRQEQIFARRHDVHLP
jgi:transposase